MASRPCRWPLKVFPILAILDAACGLNSAREIMQKMRIPVILLMSHYDSDTLNQAKKIGITTTLSKPFRGQDLLPAIEMAIALAKEVELLKADVAELNKTIENQAIIYKAKKVLLRSGGLSESEAYQKDPETGNGYEKEHASNCRDNPHHRQEWKKGNSPIIAVQTGGPKCNRWME